MEIRNRRLGELLVWLTNTQGLGFLLFALAPAVAFFVLFSVLSTHDLGAAIGAVFYFAVIKGMIRSFRRY